ncbi:MAG TPA: alpha/beta fold hydrolase [Chloroflexia bacterium]|nr:alpha/beta fold hydrolase [Chloroflexia bacterium]
MAVEVIMPKLGMTMSSGTLVRWLCQTGDLVTAGQPVCEVESEKLNTELTADVDGVITVVAAEGDEFEVGAVLGQIEPAVGAIVRERAPQSKEGAAQKILANGINLNVEKMGDGPILVLIHGLASNMGLWSALDQDKLKGHTIVSYDLRGHGGSDRPSGAHTLAKHVADLKGLLDALNIEQADLVGHSLGGMITLELAASEPSRVRSLTLISSASAFPQATRDNFFEIASAASFGGMGSVTDKLINLSFSPAYREANPKVVATIAHGIKSSDAASIAAAARMVAKLDLHPRLAAVKCPVQILVGEQDELAPPALSEELHNGIAGSRLHQIANCGHAAPVEQPHIVTDLILETQMAGQS